MATLEDICKGGALIRHHPELETTELEKRVLCFSTAFKTWLATDLAPVPCFSGRRLTPYEQTEQILYDYVIGRPMAYSIEIRKLEPLSQHVWELKTPDVKLFGWVPQKAHFIVTNGTLKKNVQRFKDYDPHIQVAASFRAALNLDEPKSVTGVLANDIL